MDETCEKCRFNGGTYTQPERPMETPAGLKCLRHAPIATGGMMSEPRTIWPQVAADDWCGDYQPKREE